MALLGAKARLAPSVEPGLGNRSHLFKVFEWAETQGRAQDFSLEAKTEGSKAESGDGVLH